MLELIINQANTAQVLEVGNLTLNIGWWPFLFALIKYFLIFLTILLMVAIIMILIRVEGGFKTRIKEAVEEAMEVGRLPKTKTQKEWELIKENIKSENPEDFKNAVVLAERMFNRVLKMANFSGTNIEQRLKKIPDSQMEFKDEIIWSAKLAENIISNSSFGVDHEEAKRAINIFERALKEMNII
ncbi:hypothetical protein K0B03_02975 [Patescibacteria group bacterium]|nr:hypothetical protein [Patescibacteria group bacterium]